MTRTSLMVGAIALLLGGCGFQLRGTGENGLALKELDVQARDAYGQTLKDVRILLQDNGVHIHEGAPYHLLLGDERETSRAVTYAEGVRTVEMEVVKTMPYEIRGAAKEPLLKDSISVQRFFTRDSGNPMGNTNETANLVAEMHEDLLQHFFLRLHALSPDQLDQLERTAEAKEQAEKEARQRAHQESLQPLQSPARFPAPGE